MLRERMPFPKDARAGFGEQLAGVIVGRKRQVRVERRVHCAAVERRASMYSTTNIAYLRRVV